MVMKIADMILLSMALLMLLPLKLAIMKILTQIFTIVLIFAIISQHQGINTVFFCLVMLGNIFLTKNISCLEEESLPRGIENRVQKLLYSIVIIALIGAFSFYWFEEVQLPIKTKPNALLMGSLGLFVVMFILININKKEPN